MTGENAGVTHQPQGIGMFGRDTMIMEIYVSRRCLEKYEENLTQTRERYDAYRSMLDKIDADPTAR
jgi:hypothetical protein